MRRALIGVPSGLWTSRSSFLQRAALSSALPRPAPAPALAKVQRGRSPSPIPVLSSPKSNKPRAKARSNSPPAKRRPDMSRPPQSSTPTGRPFQQNASQGGPNQSRARFPQPSNRRGRGFTNKRGGPPAPSPLPEQLEGGLHDINYVNTAFSKDGTVVLKQKYLDTPKAHVQDYMKLVYGKPLEASYHEGHIGRTKMFR